MTRQRTAGTRTAADVLRALLGHGRSPEEDVEALRRGHRMEMVAYLDNGRRGRRVAVDLGPDPRPGCSIRDHLGGPPYRVYSTGVGTLGGADPWFFSVVDGASDHGSRPWRMAVPCVDVPLPRAVLLAVREQARSAD